MITLPYPTPDWIYEGLDSASWEPATGMVINRSPKQIQSNIEVLKTEIESLDSSAGNLRILPSVSLLVAPINSPYNIYLTESVDDGGNGITANRSNDSNWTFSSHSNPIVSGLVVSATSTRIVSTSISNLIINITPGKYLLQITNGAAAGYSRLITASTTGLVEWAEPLGVVPAVNSSFEIYQSNFSFLNSLSNLADDSLVNAIIFGE